MWLGKPALDFDGLLVREPVWTSRLGLHLEQNSRGIFLPLFRPKRDPLDELSQVLFHMGNCTTTALGVHDMSVAGRLRLNLPILGFGLARLMSAHDPRRTIAYLSLDDKWG